MSDLLLDVGQMREAEVRIDRTFAAGVLPADQSVLRIVAPVALKAVVRKDHMQFRLVGRMKTTVELTCSRCLERFPMDLDEGFDVLYLPRGESRGAEDRAVEDDDLSTAFYSDHVIDLGQLMQEQCYLTVPMKPLCRESCKGLCAECGTNLNTASCSCRHAWVDSRLATLERLRRDT